MTRIGRRNFVILGGAWAYAACGASPGRGYADQSRFSEPQAFNFDWLRQQAKERAERPYSPMRRPAPEVVGRIDFDASQAIRFRPDRALWPKGPAAFPVRLFHLDKYSSRPVRINVVTNGEAREVIYSPEDFEYGDAGLKRKLPQDLGYSGFRVMDGPKAETDWVAFKGASYFRSAGEDKQYGASARGIAVNTGLSVAEEFPDFTEFWLSESENDGSVVTVYALLDGPSVAGAFRMDMRKMQAVTMDVTADLYFRADVERLGIAPMTSMYWYGENDRRIADDWRPEIHDSDGLAIWTGNGERIWRPLINPGAVRTNSFIDRAPRGFGLMQRDREFSNYQDDGAFYNRRPSIWIEPVGDWGEGAVELVEIPTREEIHDNIVAFWTPRQPATKGGRFHFSYRIHWRNREPNSSPVARAVATRIGRGGIPGQPSPDNERKRKFVIDFAGGPLADMEARYDITPVVTQSRGTVDNAYVIKVVGTEKWRAFFDLRADGTEPVDLRCYLRLDDKTLSETWLYQYLPVPREG